MSSLMPQMGGLGASAPISEKIIDDHLNVQAIIRSYQVPYQFFILHILFLYYSIFFIVTKV